MTAAMDLALWIQRYSWGVDLDARQIGTGEATDGAGASGVLGASGLPEPASEALNHGAGVVVGAGAAAIVLATTASASLDCAASSSSASASSFAGSSLRSRIC